MRASLILLCALSLACEEAVERPALGLAESGSVSPRHVCPAQGGASVSIAGEGFSPHVAPGDGDDLEIELPSVTLEGEAKHAFSSVGDEALSWRSQGEMRLTLSAELGVEPGLYDLSLSAPGGDAVTEEGALFVVAPPSLTALEPGLICLSQEAREVALSGASFIHIGDEAPTLSVNGEERPLEGTTGCEDISHAEQAASRCDAATLALGMDELEAGAYELQITNPEPIACQTTEPRTLTVVTPPEVTLAEPALICPTEGGVEVQFSVEGALRVDGADPVLTISNLAGEVAPLEGAWSDCEAFDAPGYEVERCAAFTATIAQETPDQHYRPTLEVTNPEPAGCAEETRGALWVLPPPVITAIGPTLICAEGAQLTLEITGEGIFQIGDARPEVMVGDVAPSDLRLLNCAPLDIPGVSVLRCPTIEATFDRATLDGTPLTLRNPAPAACGTEATYDLTVIGPPTIEQASPLIACPDAGVIPITFEGAHFIQAPEDPETGTPAQLPRIRVGGRAIMIEEITLQGCENIGPPEQGWSSCDQLTFNVNLENYAPGVINIEVENPPPSQCGDRAAATLVIPPAMGVNRVLPTQVCGDADPVPITITGQGFISVDGEPPALQVGGSDLTPRMLDCQPLEGAPETGGQGYEVCRTMEVDIIPGALPAGPAVVEVTNAGELACAARAEGLFMPIAPPTVSAVEPAAVCGGVERTLEISGEGFIEEAMAYLGGVEGEVDFIDDETLSVRFPAEAMVAGEHDLRVFNAEGCEVTEAAAVAVSPQPEIVSVEPASVSNAAEVVVRVTTSGLSEPANTIQLIPEVGAPVRVDGAPTAEDPNLIDVTIPAGLTAGAWRLRVISRGGCVGAIGGALEITEGS